MTYLSQQDIFDLANKYAKEEANGIQQEVADRLDVSRQAAHQMLNGKPKMLSLALRWIQLHEVEIETEDGKPKRYYRIAD